jgi:hypothetical protein
MARCIYSLLKNGTQYVEEEFAAELGTALYWDRSCGRYLGRRTVDIGQGAHPVLLMEARTRAGLFGGLVLDTAGRVVGIGVAMTNAGYPP